MQKPIKPEKPQQPKEPIYNPPQKPTIRKVLLFFPFLIIILDIIIPLLYAELYTGLYSFLFAGALCASAIFAGGELGKYIKYKQEKKKYDDMYDPVKKKYDNEMSAYPMRIKEYERSLKEYERLMDDYQKELKRLNDSIPVSFFISIPQFNVAVPGVWRFDGSAITMPVSSDYRVVTSDGRTLCTIPSGGYTSFNITKNETIHVENARFGLYSEETEVLFQGAKKRKINVHFIPGGPHSDPELFIHIEDVV